MDRIMRYPGGKKKAVTLSYDDAVQQDIKLMEILNRYGLKATFNINSGLLAAEGTVYPTGEIHRIMTRKEALDLYRDAGHEIAVHTYTHPHMEKLSQQELEEEIRMDIEGIREMFGIVPRGMAYPYGTFNDTIVECFRRAGIVYGRTVIRTGGFDIPKDWMRLEATCHHDDAELFLLVDSFLEKEEGLFYLWGHSYEFEISDNWKVIEEFGKKIGNREDIWYATNIEVFDYIKAYEELEITETAGGKMQIYNPSEREIWFAINGQEILLEARKTWVSKT